MKKIDEYSITDHGIEGSQYFQGHSVGDWNDCATGCGSNPYDALEDALESLAQNDWNTESNTELCIVLDALEAKCPWPNLILEACKEYADEETLKEIKAFEDGEGDFPETDLHYYVSINVNQG